jgi:protein TonB
MATALYEFMPYGAPDLIDGARSRMARATAWSTGLWIALFLVALAWLVVHPREIPVERTVVVPYRELAAPPPLTEIAPPPQIVPAGAPAAPAMGIPVPVPETQAPPEQTIASQEEIAAAAGSGVGEGGPATIVIEAPPPEELPKLGDYVYADELPVLITDVPPRYPDIAREAQTEGEVLLRVLVGKDGRVADVHVDQSVPMFDEAAVQAARKWVFRPALSGNRPVAVWIVRRVRFRLETS